MKKSLIFIVGVLFMISFVSGFVEPPYIPVVKPTPVKTVTVCASGCDYQTLEQADQAAQPGWLIRIKAGTYTPTTWDSSGTPGNEIVIEAFGDGDATFNCSGWYAFFISGQNVIFDGGPDKQLIVNGSGLSKNDIAIFPRSTAENITFSRIKALNDDNTCINCVGVLIQPNGNYFKLYNSEIYNSGYAAVYGDWGNYHEIRNNILHDNAGPGIQYNPHGTKSGGQDWADEVTIAGNIIYNNGKLSANCENGVISDCRQGITILSNDNELYDIYIYNNIIWDNKKSGISAGGGTNSKPRIYNNVIYGNIDYGLKISTDDTIAKNNIIYGNGPTGSEDFNIPDYNVDLNTIDFKNNLVGTFKKTHQDFSSLSIGNMMATDPEFISTDPLSDDFLKLSSNSPAIDTGADLKGIVDEDYFGTSRPQGNSFDIGAHEYLSSSTGVIFEDDFDSQADWTITQPDDSEVTIPYYPGATSGKPAPPAGWSGYRNSKSKCGDIGYNLWYLNPSPGYPKETGDTSRGGNGKSLTFWSESCTDQFENSDNPLAIDLGSDYNEIYVRFYIKFQSDWQWKPSSTKQQKFYHVQNWQGNCDPFEFFTAGMPCNNPLSSGGFHTDEDNSRYWYYAGYRCEGTQDTTHYYCQDTPPYTFDVGTDMDHVRPGGAWLTSLGDGNWHSVELYFKMNTDNGGTFNADGSHTIWLDGNQVYNTNNIPFSEDGSELLPRRGFRWITIGGNNNNRWTTTDCSIDGTLCEQWYAIDDVVISTNYIGPSCTSPIHPADTDCTGTISIGELMTYIGRWKDNEVGVTISTLFDALVIWKG